MASNKKTPPTRAGDPLAEMEKELAALKEMLLKTRARHLSEAEKAAAQAMAVSERTAKALAKAEEKSRSLAAKATTPDQQKQLRAAQTALKVAEKAHADALADADAANRLVKRLKPVDRPTAPAQKRPKPAPIPTTKRVTALKLVNRTAPAETPPEPTPSVPAASAPPPKAAQTSSTAAEPKSTAKPAAQAKPATARAQRRPVEPMPRDEDELPRVIRDEKLPPGRMRSLFDPFD